jgi:hypothetical protein
MNALESRLAALSDAEALEAATFYLAHDVEYADSDTLASQLRDTVASRGADSAQLFHLLDRIKADRQAYRYLIQSVLRRAANGTPAERARLEEALRGINKNQVAVELLFAIYAASMVTIVWLANPPTKTTTTTTVEHRPDGTSTATTTTTREEVPPPVKELYGWIKGVFGATKPS